MRRVLIIEDQIKLVQNLKRALEIERYEVDTALDGEDGLKKALSNNYNLIILDLMLPKKDGIEICKTLRKRAIRTSIIMLTARGLPEDRVLGLDSGADDYLVKPFSLDELFARMRSILRRRKPTDATILTVADLTLNAATREAKRGRDIIKLTFKEYSLLDYLMRYAGQTISQQRLLEHLWGAEARARGPHLAIYIRYLRRKIDDAYKKKLIITVKGFGYKIQG